MIDIKFPEEFMVKNDFLITIIRCSINNNSTTGELLLNEQFICHTLEKPWQNNQSYISSIPTGIYEAFVRYDKDDQWRIQLKDVPDRTGVQIHIGNFPSEIEGCVLVGEVVVNKLNKLMEGTSAPAYSRLKRAFYGSDNPNSSPDLKIKVEIRYNIGPTEYENDERKILWVGQANWQTHHRYAGRLDDKEELKRDLTHIYFRSLSNNNYSRIQLHGGTVEISNGANGPWELGYGIYKRKN